MRWFSENLSARRAARTSGLASAVALAFAFALPGTAQAGGTVELEFDPANFPAPLTIDNAYFPLVPGTISTFLAEGDDGCEWNVITVTYEQYVVEAGVTARVVEDKAYEDEACDGFGPAELVEDTDDWFAQDSDGNVWYLGEYSLDCEGAGDCHVSPGSWEAGVDGAEAGIQMLASRSSGDQYYQEFYEGFAEDQAKIERTDVWVSLYDSEVFDSDLHHCLKIKEWTRLESGHIEHKFYCPDTGLVSGDELMGKTLHFELVDLSPEP